MIFLFVEGGWMFDEMGGNELYEKQQKYKQNCHQLKTTTTTTTTTSSDRQDVFCPWELGVSHYTVTFFEIFFFLWCGGGRMIWLALERPITTLRKSRVANNSAYAYHFISRDDSSPSIRRVQFCIYKFWETYWWTTAGHNGECNGQWPPKIKILSLQII